MSSQESATPAAAEGVVVTGTGLVSALGLDRWETWDAICRGGRPFGPLTVLEQRPQTCKGGAEAASLPADPDEPREVTYLRRALSEAMREAGIAGSALPYPSQRCAMVLGTTLHGMRAAGRYFREQHPESLRRFQAAAVLEQLVEGLHLEGGAVTTCAACSSGLSSIGLAMTMLQTGEVDLVIAGGYDTISEYAYGGFNALRLIADGPVRPFCRGREGMKLGEGYGILIMERARDAATRGIRRAWPVLGYGETADAHHLTQPHPEGDGASRAMEQALAGAGLEPADVDLIAAHGTGTPSNERGEAAALARVFGDRLSQTPIVALKSHLGHTLGGAGAVELILGLTALERGVIPPTANVQPDLLEYPGLRFCERPEPAELRRVLGVSVGFGGANTCAIVGKPVVLEAPTERNGNGQPASRMDAHAREVVISGIGVVLPEAIGNEAFAARLLDAARPMVVEAPPPIDVDRLVDLLQAPRVRRMSDYVKLSLAATRLALADAQLDAADGGRGCCAAMLGTAHGSASYSADYYRQLVDEGVENGNAMLFAEGVPNAGAAHLSLMLGLKGPCQTIIGSRTSGLDALRIAALRIASGRWDRVLVGAAEEATPIIEQAYRHTSLHTLNGHGGGPLSPMAGFVMSPGAVTLVVESRAAAEARGARIYGVVESITAATAPSDNAGAASAIIARMLTRLGDVEHVVMSANSSWLGRTETAGVARAARGRAVTASSLYGHVAETFSVLPLASIAALLLTGRLPRLHGEVPATWRRRLQGATGDERPRRAAVVVSDPHGPVAAARVAVTY